MAWHVLLWMLLGLSHPAYCEGGPLDPCKAQEDNATYVALYIPANQSKDWQCECDITSTTTLNFVFKLNSGGNISDGAKSKVILWNMIDNSKEEDLVDRKEVNGTHFRLVFQSAMSIQETNVQSIGNFSVRCSPQRGKTSNKSEPTKLTTACATQTSGNKATGNLSTSVSPHTQSTSEPSEDTQVPTADTTAGNITVSASPQIQSTSTTAKSTQGSGCKDKCVIISVTCAVSVTVVGLVITACCCIRKKRKPLADKSRCHFYDTDDHLCAPDASDLLQPMTSVMTCNRDGRSHTLDTDTTLLGNTPCRPLTDTGYDSVDETAGRLNIRGHRDNPTYDIPLQRSVTTDACAIYAHSRPQEDVYHILQRGQERQPIIDNVYNTTSTQIHKPAQ